MQQSCSHGKLWTEPCESCEIVSLRETILKFEPMVDRAKARLAILTEYRKCDIGNCCLGAVLGGRFCEKHMPRLAERNGPPQSI